MDISAIILENTKMFLGDVVIYPTLYKLNTSGKILTWCIERDCDCYRTISGQEDGLKTTSAWTEAIGKNTGKKNGTNNIEQAIKECLAKYEKKLKSGSYFLDKTKVTEKTYIKPMLAETYYSETFDPETNKSKIKNNKPSAKDFKLGIFIQPKYDGIRCIISSEGAFSRKGESIQGVPHILENLKYFFLLHPQTILDGELYCHELEFNEISGTIRRDILKDTAEQKNTRLQIEYFVYDLIDNNIYSDRLNVLTEASKDWGNFINLVPTQSVENCEQINSIHDDLVAKGYEGAIVRKSSALYQQNKRTKDLLKVKQFQDKEYTILDIIEGVGNNAGMASKIKIEDNSVEIFPNMTGSWSFCKTVLDEKEDYIGGETTIKFFGRTPDGSLRHPIVKTLYKNKRDM